MSEQGGQIFKGKNILVTGGTGLIGIPLVEKLKSAGARLRVVSLDDYSPWGSEVECIKADLCEKTACLAAVRDMDIVFHLAGLKGGIGVAGSRAANFLVKNILMNTHLMEAARAARVEKFLFASSICIYPPAEVFREEDAQTGLPHVSDRFGGMAKLLGELQIQAYEAQYNLKNFFIARPVNTYGPYDNFEPQAALIIPSLIYRIFHGEDPLVVWGDGSAERDFIYADDAADFFSLMMAKGRRGPFNVGTGVRLTIRELVEELARQTAEALGKPVRIAWDRSRPTGEKTRVASMEKAKNELGWLPAVDLAAGLGRTIRWYRDHGQQRLGRYTILSEG